MSRRAVRRARLVRGAAVALAGAGLGLTGHVLAGGGLPASPALLLLVALAAGVCTLVSDRQWSYRRLLVALGGTQLLVHLALASSHATHGLTANPANPANPVNPANPANAAHAAPGPSGWVMLAAHAAAALLTAWLLREGEALFWRAVERLRPRPLWPRVAAPYLRRLPWQPSWRVDAGAALLVLVGSVARRGPPSLAVA
jgi:hypothetical protein